MAAAVYAEDWLSGKFEYRVDNYNDQAITTGS